jgi:CheY-like chemotaxis protein
LITDRGEGISEDRLDKIFEPYYTTKEFGVQRGTGLGLSISKSIIKKHSGDLTVKSKVGFGTTFNFYLPADNSEAICKDTILEVKGERSIFGNGKILVMDDEKIIRTLTKHILTHLGYNAEFAQDGKEAIDLYQNAMDCGKPFDAVILDLTIRGGMGGQEAIKKLSEIDPNIKGIVSSGYSLDPVMANFRDFGFCDVIAKPYTVEEMAEKLNHVIERAMT